MGKHRALFKSQSPRRNGDQAGMINRAKEILAHLFPSSQPEINQLREENRQLLRLVLFMWVRLVLAGDNQDY